MTWAGALALLRALLELIGLIVRRQEEAELEQKREERSEAHERIDDDPDGFMRDLRWLRDSEGPAAVREDGTPVDYSVSGPSGALRNED
jgi:hypothetical protein